MQILLLCVNYNCADTITNMLDTISMQTRSRIEVVIVDNSGELDATSSCCVLPGFKRCHLVSPGKNLGYFGGAHAGYLARDTENDADITMIVNPDILFSDDFFDVLSRQRDLWPADTGVVFPAVYDTHTKRDSNPFIRLRPSRNYLNTRIFFFGGGLRHQIWLWLYRQKAKRRKAAPMVERSTEAVTEIYAGHGSLLMFLPAYFNKGASLAFESFLYGEELFVAEMCREAGLKCYHDTSLTTKHVSHVVTSTLSDEQRRKWQLDSLRYIKNRFS
mgnify:FL=1